MGYWYPGTEGLWYGNWSRRVRRQGKREVDRLSWSKGENPYRKEKCCSSSCLWHRVHWDISEWENSQSVLLMDKTSSMYELYVKLNWDAYIFFQAESGICIHFASYEYRNMSATRGAPFVPIGMSTIYWKTFPRRRRTFCRLQAKEKYRGMFETQKSGNKTGSGEIGLDIRTHASPKLGQSRASWWCLFSVLGIRIEVFLHKIGFLAT